MKLLYYYLHMFLTYFLVLRMNFFPIGFLNTILVMVVIADLISIFHQAGRIQAKKNS